MMRSKVECGKLLKKPEVAVMIPKVLLLEAHNGGSYIFFQELSKIAELHFESKEGRYMEWELMEIMGPYDAIMITSQHDISSRVIDSAPKLKIIAKRGAKPENVDIEAATKNGTVVTWTPGANYVSVAEHTIMLMLCLARKTISQMNRLKNGDWRFPDAGLQELYGKTVGIIGLGGIGREAAKLAGAFNTNILAYDPYVSKDRAEETGAKLTSLEKVLKESDYVTLHAALTEKTRHLIDEKELKMMKKGAYLINTARGGLINEKALVKALQKGTIAGAGLDVFQQEPPERGNPLLRLPNVVVTPHMAGWPEEAVYREQKEAAMEIMRVLRGDPPKHPLNPEVLEEKGWQRLTKCKLLISREERGWSYEF